MNVLFETGESGSTATTHDWLTPPELLATLGEFDLDPCASEFQPWRTARQQFTIHDDGLTREWAGRVWCNPPYGPHAARWLERCAAHGNAIALVFARTETTVFQDHVWPKADAMLFLRGRLSFRLPGGGRAGNSGAPSVLIAFGKANADALAVCGLSGTFIRLRGAE
ncbi:phage N-6-adenine-methyltransferase [Pandoraea apista]|uniref:phage N-6-adenine-methyltransferase n=1 Tax=Pandoraea apista TaxID=93218 RepID=UPI000B9D4CB3|nr:phage N-6-adenine-methyltransferase [Pandoraea apista]OXS89464.1 hypothetical protein B7H01_19350 [Pandoraea apista]